MGDSVGGAGYELIEEYACYEFNIPWGYLSGNVKDLYGAPMESVYVSVEQDSVGLVGDDWTLPDGSYNILLGFGNMSITFIKEGYVSSVFDDFYMHWRQDTLDAILYPVADTETVFWFGNLTGTPVSASIGRRLDINVFMQSAATSYGDNIHVDVALEAQYFDSMSAQSSYYYPITEWEIAGFEGPFGSPPNPDGWTSVSFIADKGCFGWAPWLHLPIPAKIITFNAWVSDDSLLDGTTSACMDIGAHPDELPFGVGDTLTGEIYPYAVNISEITFTFDSPLFEYLPGDAQMALGLWPPDVRGADVTFLVNYFRGWEVAQPCYLDGIYCSADANGDCQVIGSDVTKLIMYYRQLTQLQYCPDHPPAWLTADECPVLAPPGWPGCE
jgi:hypothetical protein